MVAVSLLLFSLEPKDCNGTPPVLGDDLSVIDVEKINAFYGCEGTLDFK